MTKSPRAPRRVVIPAGCASLDDVYDIFARGFALPRHFGRNLDALHDVLSADVKGPFEIVVEDARGLEARLGTKGKALLKLLREIAAAREDAHIVIEKRGR